MMSIKHSTLAMLLAVYRCFSSAPLSLIQRQIEDIYYFGTAVPPKIIPWYSSKTSRVQLEVVNRYVPPRFTAAVTETISCLNWFLDNLKRNNPEDSDNHWEFFGDKTLNLSIINNSIHMRYTREIF